MIAGLFITARLGSTRLSRKHLKEVNGKPIVSFLIDRIHNAFSEEVERGEMTIIIATGRDERNRELEQVSDKCIVFYGNDDNIPKRHLEAAKANNIDSIISIDGDDILCSTSAMKLVKESLADGKAMVKTTGLPLGMNVMGYQTDFLENSLADVKEQALETGWGRIFENSEITEIPIESYDNEDLRFTLDYDLDYNFFSRIISGLNDQILDISDKELIDYVVKNKVYEINAPIAKEYWVNFNKNLDSEKASNKEV